MQELIDAIKHNNYDLMPVFAYLWRVAVIHVERMGVWGFVVVLLLIVVFGYLIPLTRGTTTLVVSSLIRSAIQVVPWAFHLLFVVIGGNAIKGALSVTRRMLSGK